MHTYSARTEAMTHPEHCTDRRTGAARRKGTPWSLHYSTSAHRARHRGEDRPSRAQTAAGPARSSLDDVTARTKRVAHMATSICQEQRLVDFVEAAPEGDLRRLPELQVRFVVRAALHLEEQRAALPVVLLHVGLYEHVEREAGGELLQRCCETGQHGSNAHSKGCMWGVPFAGKSWGAVSQGARRPRSPRLLDR